MAMNTVMVELDRATCVNTMSREMARSSRTMTVFDIIQDRTQC
jgi:hypothetical protein